MVNKLFADKEVIVTHHPGWYRKD